MLRERNGLRSREFVFQEGRVRRVESKNRNYMGNIFVRLFVRIRVFLSTVFLPVGYPDSVSSDYLRYQIFDTLQALCSSITGLLSTQAILRGYGVGRAEANAISATMQWTATTATGMLSNLTFAWWQGTSIGQREKYFRLLADVLCDLGNCLELLSPMFVSFSLILNKNRDYSVIWTVEELDDIEESQIIWNFGSWGFLILACMGSLCKAIVGVAGGATRACLTQHQAQRDNLSDVSAKDGSQETAVNLMGLAIGFLITPLLDTQTIIWSLFIVFTILHLICNYFAVKSVAMDTLNQSRASILIRRFFSTKEVLSLNECNQIESVLQLSPWIFSGISLNFGCRIEEFFDKYLCEIPLPESPFLIRVTPKRTIVVLFHNNSNESDILKAYFYAEVLRKIIECEAPQSKDIYNRLFTSQNPPAQKDSTAKNFQDFVLKAKAQQWNCSGLPLGDLGWRATW